MSAQLIISEFEIEFTKHFDEGGSDAADFEINDVRMKSLTDAWHMDYVFCAGVV